MNWERRLAVLGILVSAAVLAFPLRGIVYQLIVIPLAYVWWVLGLLYQVFSQEVWWICILLVVLFILVKSLLSDVQFASKVIPIVKHERGEVENLAMTIKRSNKGIYFKWLVANRLGRLAYQFLLQREHGKPRSVFAPLTAEGWDSEPEIQQYLEKGLHGSFADFPNSNWNYFSTPKKTALDRDVAEVVEFLESKMENK